MKKKKTSPFKVRQTGQYQYVVTVPERGATKAAARLDKAPTITVHDMLKNFTLALSSWCSLITMLTERG